MSEAAILFDLCDYVLLRNKCLCSAWLIPFTLFIDSQSKEFLDTHSLVTHGFHCKKGSLRTEHLGLHKALCVLMGWNWDVIPDNSRVYQMSPVPEFKGLKDDLIIWPPVVIVHNVSIGDKSITSEPTKAVTNEFLKGTLKEMRFEAGKVRVCRGKPSNQNITLVKFMPTFSGLQEADRLHKHYRDKKCGRKELEEVTSKESSGKDAEPQVEAEQLFYGYMGTMEDLDKLDPETKRRCVLKSKKEIESIADAPVRVE
uniref:Protein SUPPRESSOR OF GENE SILENCING 3 n=1 Tax=Anthurium amnicola TaxID=1678845 RepID=A0A1D1Z973_9ARAE